MLLNHKKVNFWIVTQKMFHSAGAKSIKLSYSGPTFTGPNSSQIRARHKENYIVDRITLVLKVSVQESLAVKKAFYSS